MMFVPTLGIFEFHGVTTCLYTFLCGLRREGDIRACFYDHVDVALESVRAHSVSIFFNLTDL